jgi:hypothetical protein
MDHGIQPEVTQSTFCMFRFDKELMRKINGVDNGRLAGTENGRDEGMAAEIVHYVSCGW